MDVALNFKRERERESEREKNDDLYVVIVLCQVSNPMGKVLDCKEHR